MTRAYPTIIPWRFSLVRPSVLGVVIALLIATVVACDAGAGITWVNQTDMTVDIYLGDDLDDFGVRMPPASTKEVGTIKAVWADVVVIRNVRGDLLFRQELTWDELEAQHFRFVITEKMLSPTLP